MGFKKIFRDPVGFSRILGAFQGILGDLMGFLEQISWDFVGFLKRFEGFWKDFWEVHKILRDSLSFMRF